MGWFARKSGSVRELLADGGLFTGAALVTGVVATIFLVAILLSPGAWQWWGSVPVHGDEQGGVVSYTYHGKPYSLDDVNSTATRARTVYVDPANPDDAVLSVAVAQISDSVVTGGLYLASAAFVLLALRRHLARNRRRSDRGAGRFGEGIDSETVRRIVAARGRRH